MIDEKLFSSLLTRVFDMNGMSGMLNIDKTRKLYLLTVRMLEENEKYNLTAITEPEKIILSHYADCASISPYLKKSASIADIGCGAGFPTLPLAILRDDLNITAIDSTAKRIGYVTDTCTMLGITNVTAIAMRAEDGGKNPEMRERFDYATARAVAGMRILTELCLPYVKVGGQFVAMKGKNAEFELSESKKAIAVLGGSAPRLQTISLTDGTEDITHPLIIIDKKAKTPALYPRPYAKISKSPL